jgi:hypothetical protein
MPKELLKRALKLKSLSKLLEPPPRIEIIKYEEDSSYSEEEELSSPEAELLRILMGPRDPRIPSYWEWRSSKMAVEPFKSMVSKLAGELSILESDLVPPSDLKKTEWEAMKKAQRSQTSLFARLYGRYSGLNLDQDFIPVFETPPIVSKEDSDQSDDRNVWDLLEDL